MVPINRSQKVFAVGACAGDLNTARPHLSISSSKQPKRCCGDRAIDTSIPDLPAARFAQLLQSPLCCRMLGFIEMNQTSRADFQDDKDIK
jgi:hypothetical protein